MNTSIRRWRMPHAVLAILLIAGIPFADAIRPSTAEATSVCPPGYTPGAYVWTISADPLITEGGALPASCVTTTEPDGWLPSPGTVSVGDSFTVTAPTTGSASWTLPTASQTGLNPIAGCQYGDATCTLQADNLRTASTPYGFAIGVTTYEPGQLPKRYLTELVTRSADLWTTYAVLRGQPATWLTQYRLRAVKPGDPTAAQDCRENPHFTTNANGPAGVKWRNYIAKAKCWVFTGISRAGVEPNAVTFGATFLPLGEWQIEAVAVDNLKGPAAGGLTPTRLTVAGNRSDQIDVNVNDLNPPTLSVSVIADTVGANKPSVGSVVTTSVTVALGTDGSGSIDGITFDGAALLTAAPADHVDLTAMAPPPPSFSLQPGEKVTFEVPVKVTATGKVTLTSSVAGIDVNGDPAQAADSTTISTPALQMTVLTDPTSIDLLSNDDGPIPQTFTATVRVLNTSDHMVTGVALQRFEPDWRDPDNAVFVLPITQTEGAVVTAATPLNLGDFDVGEAKETIATFRVTEAGDFVIEAQATSSDGIAIGSADLEVTSDVILLVDAHYAPELTAPLKPGQTVLITGRFKNQSRDETLVLQPYQASVVGHGAGGFAISLDQPISTAATSATGDECACSIPIEIAPGGSWPFQMLASVSPAAVIGPNRLEFQFGKPQGAVRAKDGTETALIDTRVRVSTRATSLEAVIDQAPTDQADAPGYFAQAGAFTVGFEEQMGRAAIGFKDLLVSMPALAAQALYKTADGEYARSAIDDAVKFVSYLDQAWATMSDADRTDLFAWAQVYGDAWLLTKPGQASVSASNAIGGFMANLGNLSATDELGFAQALGGIAGQVGFDTVSGAVIEMAVCKLAKAIPTYGRSIQAAESADQATQGARLAQREALDGKGLAALKAGEPLSLEVIRKYLGINPYELQRLLDVAAKNKVIIGLRSRSARAVELLERGAAVLKNEVWKIKTVNQIDMDFLGYSTFDEAKAVLREPISAAVMEERIASAGLDAGEALLVRSRYETRVNEWFDKSDLHPDGKGLRTEYLNRMEEGWVDVPFDPNGNLPRGASQPVVSRPRRTTMLRGTAPSDSAGEYWVIKQSNSAAANAPLLDIVGDIDLITITDETQRVLSTVEERLAVYTDLVDAIGIQHGETFTLQIEKARAKFLKDHTFGNEPLLLIHPNGDIRAGYFRADLSLDTLGDHTAFQYIEGAEVNLAKRPGSNGQLDFPEYVEVPTHSYLSPATWKEFGGAVKDVLVDRAGKIYRAGSPTSIDQWDPAARKWIINVPISADGLLHLTPQTSTGTAPKGARELPIATPGDLGLDSNSPWFQVGDNVVIDPGGPNEQFATITGFGSLILDRPLDHDIIAGTMVAMIPATTSPNPTTTPTTPTPTDGAAGPVPMYTGPLPSTGADILDALWWALALVATGATLVAVRRRRRRSPT